MALFSREETHADVRAAMDVLGPIVSSRLTYVEVRAAVGAARRGRRISAERYLRARSELAWFWERVDVVELDDVIADAAVGISDRFALRSHDSIQLASALEQDDDGLTLIALDNRLRRAAIDAGLSVAP